MSLVNITNNDLKLIEKEQQQIATIDTQLLSIRKTAIFDTLKAATDARIELIKRMKIWIDALEKKIFDANYLADLSVKETMLLFKYINNANMRVLDKIDKLEAVLNAYAREATNNKENIVNKKEMDGLQEIKKSVLDKVNQFLKTNTSDAVIVDEDKEDTKSEFAEEMKKELETLDVDISKIDLDDV